MRALLAAMAVSWCAKGLPALPAGACFSLPQGNSPAKTLVIFLHGVVDEAKGWQHGQQLGAVAAGRARGYAVMTPRGRLGAGPKGMEKLVAWPNSAKNQRLYLRAILDGWTRDKRALEQKNGAPFTRVYVAGFSSGAYFATSLAAQQAFPADGWAVFAGGGTNDRLRSVKTRARFFVGWGEDDKAKADPEALGVSLLGMGWPARAQGYAGVGHAMTAEQSKDAFDFLDGAP
jgi:predicted esterase